MSTPPHRPLLTTRTPLGGGTQKLSEASQPWFPLLRYRFTTKFRAVSDVRSATNHNERELWDLLYWFDVLRKSRDRNRATGEDESCERVWCRLLVLIATSTPPPQTHLLMIGDRLEVKPRG